MKNVKSDQIVLENKRKFLKAPTTQQIGQFVAELGVTYRSFELFYGLPKGTINQAMIGRALPAHYWHYFYEKIKPAYGAGFLDEVPKHTSKKEEKKVKEKKQEINNHSRILQLK